MNSDFDNSLGLLLQTAAYNGDAATVLRLTQEDVNANLRDRWGRTALSLAAQKGHLDIVRILIAANACIDPYEDYSIFDTPLIAAAENGHFPVVETLVKAGANLGHHGGPSQATAEYYARSSGHQKILEYFRSLAKRPQLDHDNSG